MTLPLKSARLSGRLSGALTRKSLAGLTGFGLIRDSAAAGSPDADAVGAATAKSASATRRNFTARVYTAPFTHPGLPVLASSRMLKNPRARGA
jgi:hypothetical protein